MQDCPLVLVPAYGRAYKTAQDAVHDYLTGKDFKLLYGPYCSCRDFKGVEVFLRWAKDGRYEPITSNKGDLT